MPSTWVSNAFHPTFQMKPEGFPWGLGCKESTCHCRTRSFDTPLASEQLRPCDTTIAPTPKSLCCSTRESRVLEGSPCMKQLGKSQHQNQDSDQPKVKINMYLRKDTLRKPRENWWTGRKDLHVIFPAKDPSLQNIKDSFKNDEPRNQFLKWQNIYIDQLVKNPPAMWETWVLSLA